MASSVLGKCRCCLVYCVLSPAKHILYCLGYQTVIFPGCLSVCHHLKRETQLYSTCWYANAKFYSIFRYLIVAAGAFVVCTQWSDGWARSEMLDSGRAREGGWHGGTAVHHTLIWKVGAKNETSTDNEAHGHNKALRECRSVHSRMLYEQSSLALMFGR